MVSKLIKPITSAQDLFNLAKVIGVNIDSIRDINTINGSLPKNGTFIILMRRGSYGVGHWVCVYNNEYFDPFGIGPVQKLKIDKYSKIQYQGDTYDYCGIYCLLWLYSQQHGEPDLMKGFDNLDVQITSP